MKIGDYTLREIWKICNANKGKCSQCPIMLACGRIFDYEDEPYYLSIDDLNMEVPDAEKDLL